ncbi:MAG: hypothetical protein QGG40_14680, partial [Myxococcota bacterium]|nr:hypothetical protein [Myxococcota bacterium]
LGWRRDDILEFLRENSQIGLPENVEQTLRGWMGQHGDIEMHDVTLVSVHRSQVRKLESHRQLKPFLLHRFVPGLYAVDRTRIDELREALVEAGFSPGSGTRVYPADPHAAEARLKLLQTVAAARDDQLDPVAREHAADTLPESLHLIPGAEGPARKGRKRRDNLPPRRSPREIREICERAIAQGENLALLYVSRDNQRKLTRVAPERMAINPQGQQVLVARDLKRDERLSYQIVQIERMGPA